jgi:DNA invertase Pin-like site-specific DNA recombinase
MALIGYASLDQAQDLEPQLRQLRAAGCTEIFEEKASGTSRARPELARLLNRLRASDTSWSASTGSPGLCRTCSR